MRSKESSSAPATGQDCGAEGHCAVGIYTCRDFAELLTMYGCPYWHFSESINGLAARKPATPTTTTRRGTWHTHGWPWNLTLMLWMAVLTTCLVWGYVLRPASLHWPGTFAENWRSRFRHQVVSGFAKGYLRVARIYSFTHLEPKTRYRAARRQAAKLEQADLVQLIDLAFAGLKPEQRLWPFTPQTLRKRLDSTLERLGIPTARVVRRPLGLTPFHRDGRVLIPKR